MSTSSSREKVAVIGGGIVGLSVAMELLNAGYEVTVVERDELMQACSAGNAGYLSEANIFPPASPEMLWMLPRLLFAEDGPLVIRPSYLGEMVPWGRRAMAVLGEKSHMNVTQALASMTRIAFGSISKLAERAQATELLSRDGGLMAFKTVSALEKKAKSVDIWNRHGLPVRRLSADELRELEPALVPEVVGGLLFEQSGRCSNPKELGLRYAHHLNMNGAHFVRDEVKALTPDSTAGVVVNGSSRKDVYAHVVVCTGFWSKALMAPYYRHLPLVSERGYHLMLPRSGVALKRPTVFGESLFVATPMDEGLRLAGTAEFAKWNSTPNWNRAHRLLNLAGRYLRHIDGEQAKPWMGVRPSLPDGLPAIGTVKNIRGLHYAFGHAHNGLTLSAVTAKCVAALVRGATPPVAVQPMALERFQ